MTNVLLILMLVLLAPMSALSVTAFIRMRRKDILRESGHREQANEQNTEDRSMDEGFSNLMTYSVKLGRGRTSGGEP